MLSIAEYKVFFNKEAILSPAEKMKARVYKQFGAYTRTVAKNSMIDMGANTDKQIKRRERALNRAGFIMTGGRRVSMPGSPAFSRVGHVKRHIYFAADAEGVVIGPALLAGVRSEGQAAVHVLEYGGSEQITAAEFSKGKRVLVRKTAQYKARPTMRLAFAKAMEKQLPKLLEAGIMREV